MKNTFVWTFVAVLAGIWLYNRYKAAKLAPNPNVTGTISYGDLTVKPAEGAVFYGPFLDPVTGAYLGPGAQPGTSSYPVQPIGG